jgi:hypothetical protein
MHNSKQGLFDTAVSESRSFKISLSAKRLANISHPENLNDFELIVGESHYPLFLVL